MTHHHGLGNIDYLTPLRSPRSLDHVPGVSPNLGSRLNRHSVGQNLTSAQLGSCPRGVPRAKEKLTTLVPHRSSKLPRTQRLLPRAPPLLHPSMQPLGSNSLGEFTRDVESRSRRVWEGLHPGQPTRTRLVHVCVAEGMVVLK